MQKLLWKLFPPYEVKLTVEEVKAFFKQREGLGLSNSIIEPQVLALAKDAGKVVYTIRIDRMKPDQLALILITNVLGQHLGSGQHHIYRGVLSMTGNDMLALWHQVQSELLKRGYCSEAEVEKDNRWVREQIKGAG